MTRMALPSRLSVSTAIQMLAGGAFMIVLGVARGELARVHPAQISLGAAAALAYLVVVGSLVGFSTYTWLLATTRTPLISTYAYVNPVVAVLLGWMFLNERLTAQTLAASSLIVVAVAMIVWARRTREPLSTEAPPGGPAPETILQDNIQSAAILFAAIDASVTGQTVDIQAKAREAIG